MQRSVIDKNLVPGEVPPKIKQPFCVKVTVSLWIIIFFNVLSLVFLAEFITSSFRAENLHGKVKASLNRYMKAGHLIMALIQCRKQFNIVLVDSQKYCAVGWLEKFVQSKKIE